MSCCFFRTLWVLPMKASAEASNARLQSEPWVKHFGFLSNRNTRTTTQGETQSPSSQESCIHLWPVVETHNKHLRGTEWHLPHVLSQLWAGCTTGISSSFSHREETVACPDTGITETACWHDGKELADTMAGCYDFSWGYWEVRSWVASTVGESYVVSLKWSAAFQKSYMHEPLQRTSPALVLEHHVHG